MKEYSEDTSFRGVIPVGPSSGDPDPTGDPVLEPERWTRFGLWLWEIDGYTKQK